MLTGSPDSYRENSLDAKPASSSVVIPANKAVSISPCVAGAGFEPAPIRVKF